MTPESFSIRKHLLGAVLTGLALRLFFVWRFPAVAGDTGVYEELARNWLDHGIYGLWLNGQLTPVDLRAPGYPAFLAAIFATFGRARIAVMLVQVLVDLGTCLLTGAVTAWLAPVTSRARAVAAAVWLAALCPFVANYAAVPLTEVLATFLTAAALLVLLVAVGRHASALPHGGQGAAVSPLRLYFFGGLIVGLGTLVRPETPLLLASVGFVLCIRWRQPADWPRLIRAGVFMALGLALPLLPWGARNYLTLGRAQFLAPRYAELPGEFVPHGFNAWTKTWVVRFRDVYLVPWKLDDEPINIDDINPAAFDSPDERARVAAILERYNEDTTLTPALDAEFAQLARERAARHPLRTWLWIPLERAVTLWFTPRIELLPFSGHLSPLARKWEEDPLDFTVTLGFGLLNFLVAGLALAGAWKMWRLFPQRSDPQTPARLLGLCLIVAFALVRTVFLTQIETPEPRYVVVCFPALLALAAQLWIRPPSAL
ncbi:MAG: hypothetical protein HY234_10935 [Acidobacteria bacterium]|nr:hypothetical protein [Acidobacteriota bacterium]